MFSPFDLPDGIFLLITDELAAPADFALISSLISHLKCFNKTKIIYLSILESWNRLQSLCTKSGINLSPRSVSETLHFIDVLSHLPRLNTNEAPSLRIIYDLVAGILEGRQGGMIILDDISSLEWTGHSLEDLSRFCRALRVLCLKTKTTLIVRHHILAPNEPDELLRRLQQICSYHMDVRPLSSGRSGAVSGEIALHAGPSLLGSDSRPESVQVKLLSRQRALQYRLTDSDVVFFERGSSRGVL
ncbi:hypothetical protein E1B28_003293 [Marasmius oreades]|uniref:Elongator complex protein 5 n=1 Tax=Marasmius oreades TaxID=181124 RepID=A0A9P7RMA0_9AGAR|nr:uncharacterized protein E1B28_003293 [Marasmius oreades]KAG7085750.1 hypothetical protein E1B28_003293 [Marasmius oreades]